MKFNFLYLVIVALVAVIIIQRSCGNSVKNSNKLSDSSIVKIDGKKYDIVSKKVDTVEVSHDVIIYQKGKDIKHDSVIYVAIPSNIDTQEIVRDYFSKNIYIDTFKLNDSCFTNLGYVVATDTIFKNKIFSRKWDAHIESVDVNNSSIVKGPLKNQFYFGGSLGIEKPSLTMLGADLLLKNKKDHIYILEVGETSNFNFYIQGKVFWKISFNK